MALTYQPPGVNVSETVGTTVSPDLAAPTTVCLIGLASGAISGREQLIFQDQDADNDPLTPNAPVPIALRGLPVDATLQEVTEVVDAFSGRAYVVGTDYSVNTTDRTLTRITSGAIADGTVVRVAYSYRPANYFDAQRYSSLQEVERRFGPAWSDDGLSIGTPLSHAALVAMENGAGYIVIQPLFSDTGTARVQPTPAQEGNLGVWQSTLEALRDFEDINVVVPVLGQRDSSDNTLDVSSSTVSAIFSAVQDHVWFMRTQDQFVMAVLGEDNTQGVSVTPAVLINHAASLSARHSGALNEQTVLVSPARFIRGTATSNATMYVGGQYAAAAVAGQMAGRRVETSLTRKPLAGFVQVGERHTKEDKNAQAQAGILVVEQRGEQVQVRHGVTLATNSPAAREISVVRAKHFMVESLYNTFENQVIGLVVGDGEAADLVRSTTVAALERLRSLNIIARYRNVDARVLETDPTSVEVRFSYQPLFPINFVDIVFSIDMTQGTITNVTPGAVG